MGEQVIVLTELTKQYGKFTAVEYSPEYPERRNLRFAGSERCRKVNYYFDDAGINGAHIGNCRDLWN